MTFWWSLCVCVPCIFAAVLPGLSIRPKGNIAASALKDEISEWFAGVVFQTCGDIMFLLRYIISESKVLKLDFFSTRGPRKEEWTKWSNSVENPIIFTSVFLTNIFQVQTRADKTSRKNQNICNIWLGHWAQVNIPEKWSNLCWCASPKKTPTCKCHCRHYNCTWHRHKNYRLASWADLDG